MGKVEYVQDALAHANTGNVNAILTRELGEHFLKLGRAGVDFPVAPALHVAIRCGIVTQPHSLFARTLNKSSFFLHMTSCVYSGGTRLHLQVVHLLLMRGADPNLLYDSKFTPFPAIYYALGAFAAPTNAHAAILQKMFQTYPRKLNTTATRKFVQRTGSPPPLHAAVMHNFFDGVYLLSTTKIYDVNEKDVQGLTALHVAAWLGDFQCSTCKLYITSPNCFCCCAGNLNIILLLLHNNAAPDVLDPFRRTFVHYLACRGMFTAMHALLFDDVSPLSLEMKLRLLALRDNSGRSVLDIALIPPAYMRIVTEIVSFLNSSNMPVQTLHYDYLQHDTEAPTTRIRMGEELQPPAATQGCGEGLTTQNWVIGNCSKYTSRLVKKKIIPKIWNSIATREWSTLTEDDFKTEFFYPQRPLKLVGNFTANMEIWNYLEREVFLSRYGSLRLNVSDIYGICEEYDKERCFVTVKDYFRNSRRQGKFDGSSDTCTLTSDEKSQANPSCDVLGTHSLVGHMAVRGQDDVITDDVHLPPKFFSVCGLPSPLEGSMHLRVMSSSYAVTPLHSESAMWNVLLVGLFRHWYLISPGAALNISSNSDRRFHSNGDFDSWVQKIFPELRKHRLAVEVIQKTGDVVFVPYGWSFVTLGQGDMIDFTHNFCVLPEKQSVFGQIPTGIRMYGHVTAGSG